jgi:hypothetical protein
MELSVVYIGNTLGRQTNTIISHLQGTLIFSEVQLSLLQDEERAGMNLSSTVLQVLFFEMMKF